MVRGTMLDRSRQVALQIYEILHKRILDVELVPGTVLSRAALQMEFGVSQTPVRDALIRLQEDGVVDVYPQYATVVARIDIRHAQQAQFLRLSLELEAIRTLTRESPEETAADLAGIVTRQETFASPETYDSFDACDQEFHCKLYERADILDLWTNVRRQSVHLDRLRRLHLPMPGKMQTVLADHRAIVDAIQSANPEEATAALRRHLSGTLSITDMIRQRFPEYIKT
ncbi:MULTISPECIES: GntR family transcriptional regulator [unclassified Rhizobium]|uniref:GntR family transcriptional regulator n=1 Tax=unclassified Rhizobium TaxID=2613769 RepID=UPI00177B767D|nr:MULTISPECIES: GntR family transcriptional regulator [unclassified Rhizobium]MBD8687568.1 GntR family transcriptional regulator [Rhizobium sp. CFBP 13644]MBD8692022.1 GntR family transcriptional regulator [Rhizobium sp. CFBP 13717]